jgi:hypothetical protein
MQDEQAPDNPVETHPASAGEPGRVDRSAVRRRSESPNLLTEEELAERQERMRDTRRTVPLPEPPPTRSRRAPPEAPPDVPETDCEDLG